MSIYIVSALALISRNVVMECRMQLPRVAGSSTVTGTGSLPPYCRPIRRQDSNPAGWVTDSMDRMQIQPITIHNPPVIYSERNDRLCYEDSCHCNHLFDPLRIPNKLFDFNNKSCCDLAMHNSTESPEFSHPRFSYKMAFKNVVVRHVEKQLIRLFRLVQTGGFKHEQRVGSLMYSVPWLIRIYS
jgi:hypothetical protein